MNQYLFGTDDRIYFIQRRDPAGVANGGQFNWYKWNRDENSCTGPQPPANPDIRFLQCAQIFSGGDGVIYAVKMHRNLEDPDSNTLNVEKNGDLLWYKHTVVGGSGSLTGPKTCGVGWDKFLKVFSGGNGTIYAVDEAGDLYWYKHLDPQHGTPSWAGTGEGTRIGNDWAKMVHIFSGGSGNIYAIDTKGDLVQTPRSRWRREELVERIWKEN